MQLYKGSEIARELGIRRSTFYDLTHTGEWSTAPGINKEMKPWKYTETFLNWARKKTKAKSADTSAPSKATDQFEIEHRGDTQMITSKGARITTLEEALEFAKVNLDEWEVDRYVINSWEMGYTDKEKEANSLPLWQVKVWLKRRAINTATIFDNLLQRLNETPRKHSRVRYTIQPDPHLLEVSLFDQHIGKLAWAREAGENYDINIAEEIYTTAIRDLLQKSSGFNIERILFPIGNDFFHIDNMINQTANGTPQDVEDRLPKLVEAGQLILINAIDALRQVAPVDVLLVPGNHDRVTIWHTARYLQAWYRHCDGVTVDIEPLPRKYYRYGNTLLGFTHGDEEKHDRLPLIMATERAQDWSETTWREWHLGHLHKQKETQFTPVEMLTSVIVRVLPSLSRTDRWHFLKGYIGPHVAESFLFSRDHGLTSSATTIAAT